ncbi:flagellar assembly protein FliH [Sulfurimonas sp.]|uniref:flagellar assembly protein FliH n=1 Tax=Sulfurimonas sp. TaxID=2022749 RepID=UPI0026152B9D|nr:flagellar assembly protein FliH [Sulfurimonas sp.]
MSSIISSDELEEHNVNKYSFKVIAFGSKNESAMQEKKEEFTQDNHSNARASDIDSSALSSNSKDSLIESLMKKTDEMSSNFIKLQMKLEAKEEEFQTQLEKAKEESFAEGMKAGEAKAREELDKELNTKIRLLSDSIKKLEETSEEFSRALEGIKKELLTAALDISQEVIKIELSENSSEVAKVLSQELMKELQGASKVTLKVNPKDHGTLSVELGKLENIEIVSDSAVSEGGVVAISDVGNIDAQISKRFQRVKKAALSE